MARGKYQSAKRVSTKLLATILAVVLVLGSFVGGTMAWLIAESGEVVNTFTYGDINIGLEETDDGDGDLDENEFEMMPGQDIAKDPKVTVKADSEANWLFVKLEKSENFDEFMTYTIADGWTQLYDDQGNEVEGVYFRFQEDLTGTDAEGNALPDAEYAVLAGDKVTVKEEVTKEMLNKLDEDAAAVKYPTLTVSAFAVQYVGFEAEVSEGATEATPEQVNAAALSAWEKVEEANAPAPSDPAA